jgi:ribosome-associated translation inhibitor RaiA
MHIDVIGDDSISRQARTYAEYRLFAALSAGVNTNQIRSASLALRWAKSRRHCDAVLCTITVESREGEVIRLRALGDHPYAAINRAVDRLRSNVWPGRHDSALSEVAVAE